MTDGITIRPLAGAREYEACVALQRSTWGSDFTEVVPPALLRIAQHTGGVASGAFDAEGSLVGFVFGICGSEDGRLVHWSDMLAVRPELRDRHLGERLKRHQRDSVLARGITRMYWSFEPLESKNAYFNFARLGAVSREYQRDLYGETDSELHRGIGTDRLIALWALDTERVELRLSGKERPPAPADVRAVPVVNPVTEGTWPRCGPPDLDVDAARVRVAIPRDIQSLKSAAPGLAAEWRAHTRSALMTYIERGYTAVELLGSGSWSSYLLDAGS